MQLSLPPKYTQTSLNITVIFSWPNIHNPTYLNPASLGSHSSKTILITVINDILVAKDINNVWVLAYLIVQQHSILFTFPPV